MAARNDSTSRTLLVAFLLCLVCSVVVSTSAVALRPLQQINQELDRKVNVLRVAQLYEPGQDVEAQFAELFTARVVDLDTGEYTDRFDADSFDGFDIRRDQELSNPVPSGLDIAGIGRRENYATVYLIGDPDDPEGVVLPFRGQGLWALMRGYLALEGDGNTIIGLTFIEHGETPGLGGEVDNPRWLAQWPGKRAFADDESAEPAIRLVKGGASGDNQVDGLSGATLTNNGVSNMLRFWLSGEGFGPYLAKFREGVSPAEAAEQIPSDIEDSEGV